MSVKSESGQGTVTTSHHAGLPLSTATISSGSQLPSIDSVLLNLSTKKHNGKQAPTSTAGNHSNANVSHISHAVHAYGLQVCVT